MYIDFLRNIDFNKCMWVEPVKNCDNTCLYPVLWVRDKIKIIFQCEIPDPGVVFGIIILILIINNIPVTYAEKVFAVNCRGICKYLTVKQVVPSESCSLIAPQEPDCFLIAFTPVLNIEFIFSEISAEVKFVLSAEIIIYLGIEIIEIISLVIFIERFQNGPQYKVSIGSPARQKYR